MVNHVIDEPNLTNLNCRITMKEIENAIKKSKNGKACGSDRIHAEVLNNKHTVAIFYKLFNFCFQHGTVPRIWMEGIIHPIFKGGDMYDPLNYRGITLVNVTFKIYFAVLNNRLLAWAEESNVLNDEKNGFRTLRSCIDHMYVLYTTVKIRLLHNKETFACFIDAKKAFNKVDRDCMWYKLHDIGVRGKMFIAIKSLYTDVTCKVRVNGQCTESFPVNCGVKQGSNLSPTLFAFYINALALNIKKIECGNYSWEPKLIIITICR